MIMLPSQVAHCAPPIPRNDRPHGELIPSEESASLWLWAWPRLLGWPRSLHWLFSPVVGNKRYPGDLWGIDSWGNLLIVETKLARTQGGQDPFADFVPYSTSKEAKQLWQTAELNERWTRLVADERFFLKGHFRTISIQRPLRGTYPGVLPYSRHRDAVWRWQALYRTKISPQFASYRYDRAIRRSLRIREKVGNPPPVFVGLIAIAGISNPRLSSAGQGALTALWKRVGPNRIVLRAIQVRKYETGLRIHSWTPPYAEPSR